MDLNSPAGTADDGPARVVELVAGDFLLTVNPVDGSEIESCPPGRRPLTPRRAPAGPADDEPPAAPLLERDEERARLYRLLARGRSVRVTGPSGVGRSALLAAVARDCADLAPDGVIRLNGHRRTPHDLSHELYSAVHHTPAHRPGGPELAAALRQIGAVVVLDDLEFGGAALDELLDATPECAFLIAAEPTVPPPVSESRVDEVFLGGISRTAALELLELAIERPLDEAETDWAADLWFETEGLPLRFVQAAAVLRARGEGARTPLPDAATLTATLVKALPEGARVILRHAVALDGACPDPARLPGLTGHPVTAADHGLLRDSGLLTASGPGDRVPAALLGELLAEGMGEGSADRALAAARHSTWWFAGPEATEAEVAAEADVLLATVRSAQRAGHTAAVAALARVAAPPLAASLRWGAWERVLRSGQESARAAGDVAHQAYFHHELGVLAIVQGQLDRARVELEASIALRSVLSDAGGAVTGRRALALVDDLSSPRAQTPPEGIPPVSEAFARPFGPDDTPTQLLHRADAEEPATPAGPRRNAVAAAAGALLLAVLGTVVALGVSGGDSDDAEPDDSRRTTPSRLDDTPTDDDTAPAESPSDSPEESESESPSPSDSAEESESPEPPGTPEENTPPDPTTGGTGGSGGGTTTGGSTGGSDDPPDDPPTSGTSGGGANGDPGGDGGGEEGGAEEGGAEQGGGEEGGAEEGGAEQGGAEEGGAEQGGGEEGGGEEGAVTGEIDGTASASPSAGASTGTSTGTTSWEPFA
ncbi:ATP-binding protein [Streptomyces radicis]|uniref:ATP-binding protein n=1 Tax=Streptomyces radicis TaxID=1750517 RepID=A0A3A9WNN8_9ACTN|nr:ATP-binding protein [Streptomyces radicis]RKN09356.1 ATP-binding protein [Streptomyces radicis]RKN23046.1 ATP-binding protein [Streptomyces radicis]